MRVITADDSRITEHALRQIFTELGHEVIAHALNGREAIELCRKHRPDIVVLDIVMPPGNGDEAGIAIHGEGLAEKIIFATSQGQDVILKLARELGAKRIIKPYRADRLKQVIGELEREQAERRSNGSSDPNQFGNQ